MTKYSDHDSINNIKELMQSVNTSIAFHFHNIDVNVVRAHLNKLKSNKATGYDILPARLLKIGCDILCYSVCMANEASITWLHFIGIHYQIK